jgi:Fe-S cluster biosynthesis and repair protein YggX
MTRLIHCAKLNKEAEGLEYPPLPGELGKKIFDQISKEAWAMWVAHQTMLINEYRLSMIEPKSRAFLMLEMDKFLFGDGSEKPAGYTAPEG